MRERWKVLWKESQKDRETVRRETNAAELALFQAQEMLVVMPDSVAASALRPGCAAISSAFLWRAGQRRSLLAQKGSWAGSSLFQRELTANGLAVRERPRRVVNLHTCSASPLGRAASVRLGIALWTACSVQWRLSARAGDWWRLAL